MIMILIICEFSYEILYEVSIHLFLRAKKTWESIETLPWKLNRFGPECAHVPLFTVLIIFKSGWGQGISIFFINSLNFSFCLLFFQCPFFKFFYFQYSHMSLAVLVLEMFLIVLYFHSCGIVDIMMVMIKLAHLCCLWIVCWMWALGFVWHSEEKTLHEVLYYVRMLWSLLIHHLECSVQKKKKKPI